jgi:hypothetical protein
MERRTSTETMMENEYGLNTQLDEVRNHLGVYLRLHLYMQDASL